MQQHSLGESNQREIVKLMANGAKLFETHDETLNKGQMNGMMVNQMAVGHLVRKRGLVRPRNDGVWSQFPKW